MDMLLKPRDEKRYEVAIYYKPDTKRQPIEALMPVREYRRLLKAMRRAEAVGTFEFIMEGNVAEVTFPPRDIDTIHAVPEVTHEPSG